MKGQIAAKVTEWQQQATEIQQQLQQMETQLAETRKLLERITGAILGGQELLKIAEEKESDEPQGSTSLSDVTGSSDGTVSDGSDS